MRICSILVTVCAVAFLGFEEAIAQQFDCSRFIYPGSQLYNSHDSPNGKFAGSLRIDNTYVCGYATCFVGKFPDRNPSFKGSFAGNNMEFERKVYTGEVTPAGDPGYATQIWSGICRSSEIQGTWRDKPGTGSDFGGTFKIWRQ
jgi:hypothetical protein